MPQVSFLDVQAFISGGWTHQTRPSSIAASCHKGRSLVPSFSSIKKMLAFKELLVVAISISETQGLISKHLFVLMPVCLSQNNLMLFLNEVFRPRGQPSLCLEKLRPEEGEAICVSHNSLATYARYWESGVLTSCVCSFETLFFSSYAKKQNFSMLWSFLLLLNMTEKSVSLFTHPRLFLLKPNLQFHPTRNLNRDAIYSCRMKIK